MTETVTIELVLPTLQNLPWNQILNTGLKTLGLAFIGLLTSMSATYYLYRVAQEERLEDELILVAFVTAVPFFIAFNRFIRELEFDLVKRSYLQELEDKAEKFDELYEVEQE